jgi:hypothetical protein
MDLRDNGLIPDYVIIPNIDDAIQNKNVQLNYALKLGKRTTK